jgi:hypothetical protein
MTPTKDINKNNMQKLKRHDYSGIKRNKHVSAVVSAPYYPQKPITMKEMLTRKINKSLCICLLFTIAVTFVSYYIAMNYEAKLNALDREIVRINNENLDLHADLDRYKSFNNVDSKIGEFKLLQKADKVLEVTAMNPQDIAEPVQKSVQNKFNWALGY